MFLPLGNFFSDANFAIYCLGMFFFSKRSSSILIDWLYVCLVIENRHYFLLMIFRLLI